MKYEVNNKIIEILKRHPEGGEVFFNALDLMIRSDKNLLEDYIEWVSKYCSPNMSVGCVVTGSFGRVLASVYNDWLHKTFGQVIIVNGGIRSGCPVELPVFEVPMQRYVLLDDSYYSGKTIKTIEKELHILNPETRIDRAFVIYDGSKGWDDGIYAMYRYYEKPDKQ
jgi:hypothetical protein